MSVCLCTLAIHAPYRRRARLLITDPAPFPWIVLTDQPDDFADLPVPVRTIAHAATGPMAIDYLQRIGPTGNGNGAAAYHDKRFVLQAALRDFDTAIFLDADSRIHDLPAIDPLPPGLSVVPIVRNSIAGHLQTAGSWRLPAFIALARELIGDAGALESAVWCHETCYAVTRDGREDRFFEAWDRAARFMQARGVFSGEGGVMGLAAFCAGWPVEYDRFASLAARIEHEGGGPKDA